MSGARQLLGAASALKPDLIFLDIELDDQSALDFIPRLKTVVPQDCKIVFYTTYNKYLMQALRMEAFDFLLKPYDTSELELIMNRYRMAVSGKRQVNDPAERLSSSLFIPGAPAGISVTTITNDRMILFPKDISILPLRHRPQAVGSGAQHPAAHHTETQHHRRYHPEIRAAVRTHPQELHSERGIHLHDLGQRMPTGASLPRPVAHQDQQGVPRPAARPVLRPVTSGAHTTLMIFSVIIRVNLPPGMPSLCHNNLS